MTRAERGSRPIRLTRILHILDHSLPLQSGYVYRTLGNLGARRDFGWETVQFTTPRNHPSHPAVDVVGTVNLCG